MRNILVITYLFILSINSLKANNDSLWSIWNDTSQIDTNRLISINTIIRKNYLFNLPDSAFYFTQQQYDFAKKINNKKWMASARSIQGVSFHIQGNYYEAINYYTKALKIAEEIDDKKVIANTLNNIGIIYKEQENYDLAIKYFKKSYQIKKEIGDKMGFANTLGNLGGIYFSKGEDKIAIDYFNRGLMIMEEVGKKRVIAGFLNNIGGIYLKRNELEKALDYFNRSLAFRLELGDKRGEASCLKNLSDLYVKKNDYGKAFEFSLRALKVAKESASVAEEMQSAKDLSKFYKLKKDYKNSLEMHELYVLLSDSLGSEKNQQEVIRQEYKYEYDKKHITDSLAYAKEQEVKDLEYQVGTAKQQKQKNILYGGILFLLIVGGLMFYGYQRKKRDHEIISTQKKEVEAQKEIVEEKNKEITDSINYAKRIQNAILPPYKILDEYWRDFFILYKPKDIVAGDFYWMEHKDGKVLFAAADCTGHGVPGAMVSVVCNNGLNRSVREHGLTTPGEILDKTRELVIQEFEKSDEDVKDGMDIALCSLDLKTNELEYAGANNPLWILRKGEKEIEEIKATKQPVGKGRHHGKFKNHQLKLNSGDTLYLFSDGFADQFGGERGKKFKSTALKELVISIQEKSLSEQKVILENKFEEWKGAEEQVDDVCVIGIRI